MHQRVPSSAKTYLAVFSKFQTGTYPNSIVGVAMSNNDLQLPLPQQLDVCGTRNANHDVVSDSHRPSKVEESDEDLFTVPDVEARLPEVPNPAPDNSNNSEIQPEKRRRGRNPVDKEYRRLKRLLRNRVSAQQARERKKVYVHELESRAKELQDNNSKLEEKISTLINENAMLRKVLMNSRPKGDDSSEPKRNKLG